jgi:hypothetical protein
VPTQVPCGSAVLGRSHQPSLLHRVRAGHSSSSMHPETHMPAAMHSVRESRAWHSAVFTQRAVHWPSAMRISGSIRHSRLDGQSPEPSQAWPIGRCGRPASGASPRVFSAPEHPEMSTAVTRQTARHLNMSKPRER